MSLDDNQGDVRIQFLASQSLWSRAMSFDKWAKTFKADTAGLNPFGTGQCLSTEYGYGTSFTICGLNPFGTGQCLSTLVSVSVHQPNSLNPFGTGQCLSTENTPLTDKVRTLSQSLWNRAMSFDCSWVLEPCVARLPRATSQLFLISEKLGIDLVKY